MLSLLPASFPRRRGSYSLVLPDFRLRGNDEVGRGIDEVGFGNDARLSENVSSVVSCLRGNDSLGGNNGGPIQSLKSMSKLTPLLNPPPHGGRRLNWCFDQRPYFFPSRGECVFTGKYLNRVPSPREGEGQGGGISV